MAAVERPRLQWSGQNWVARDLKMSRSRTPNFLVLFVVKILEQEHLEMDWTCARPATMTMAGVELWAKIQHAAVMIHSHVLKVSDTV